MKFQYPPVFLGLAMLLSFSTKSQESDIIAIRKGYTVVSEGIFNNSYYKDELVVNTAGDGWRGSGYYKKKTRFFYEDDPRTCEECEGDPRIVLRRVDVDETVSLTEYHWEFYYETSALRFVYYKKENDNADEKRYYFAKDGRLIRYLENKDILPKSKADTVFLDKLKQEANRLQALFVDQIHN